MLNRSELIDTVRRLRKQHEEDGRLLSEAEALLMKVSAQPRNTGVIEVAVRSHSRPYSYMVRLHSDPSLDECQCESHQYRGTECKHIKEARLRAPMV